MRSFAGIEVMMVAAAEIAVPIGKRALIAATHSWIDIPFSYCNAT
jgi:hypothetical protein